MAATLDEPAPAFAAAPAAAPAPAALAPNIKATAEPDIRVEVRCANASIVVKWPLADGASCAATPSGNGTAALALLALADRLVSGQAQIAGMTVSGESRLQTHDAAPAALQAARLLQACARG